MTSHHGVAGRRSTNLVLATLFLGTFVLGSSELLVVGLLNLIATDLQVSIPTAFAALTYIVPFLEDVTGISGALISMFILTYGVAAAVGSFGGGRFADQNAARTLIVTTVAVAACLATLLVFGANPLLAAPALLALGAFAMGTAPSYQYRVVSLAGPGGALAQSLPASAANLGIAVGSFAGGVAIGTFETSGAVIAGLLIALIAVPVAWGTSFLKPPTVHEAVLPEPRAEAV